VHGATKGSELAARIMKIHISPIQREGCFSMGNFPGKFSSITAVFKNVLPRKLW
jgi:hypothetical protein